MTPMARTHPWSALVVAAARRCLMADPHWTGDGFARRPDRGWAAHAALMGALLSRTPMAVAEVATDAQSALEWLDAVTGVYTAAGFDAHDYLYQSWAYEAHDVESTPGLKGAALEALDMPALILAPPLDLFNPHQCAQKIAGQIPGAQLLEIPSLQGHGAASSGRPDDGEFLNKVIQEFLRDS
jgi:homoserine O-acetyltransferase